jgi:hypothetical protein
LFLNLDFSSLLIHHKDMKEKEMEKFLLEILDQEGLNQLESPFILDREETDSPFPYVMSDIEPDQSTFHQKDFLMHNSLKLNDKKD